jgi:hypothetical protein
LLHGLSNGLAESVNTRIRLLTRIAFGFKSPEALIGLACSASAGCVHRFPDGPNQPTDEAQEP